MVYKVKANNRPTNQKAKELVAGSVETQFEWLHYLSMWEAELEESQTTCQTCKNKAYCSKCFPCSLSLGGGNFKLSEQKQNARRS